MIAAITAGGRADDPFARELGVTTKALASVSDITMLDRAIDAARATGARRIVIIGGAAVRAHCGSRVDDVIDESDDGRENIRRAMAYGTNEPLLLSSSDMPFVTPSAMAEFVERARDCDLALPLAEADAYESTYPGAPPHVTRLGRDRIANGNVVYFGAGVAPRALDASQQFFDARKSLVRMAVLLGPALLLRFATRRLRVAHVEARGSELLDCTVRAIRGASPTLCFDVDSIADYRYAVDYAARS